MLSQAFKETGRIITLLLRQHRLKIILWFLGILGVTLSVVVAYSEIYSTSADLLGLGITMQNPAMISMLGPTPDPGAYTPAVAFAGEMLIFTAIATTTMNILLISAMTREDEESGRLELIQSLPVGRQAYTSASLVIMSSLNALIFLSTAIGLVLTGGEHYTWEASLLYGAVLGMTGVFFASITVVCAQLSETARGTKSLAFGVLIVSYMIRAIGDVSNETLSLTSPLGWTVRTEVFINNEWWPIMALGVSSAILMAIGIFLNQRRDLFQGLLPDRPGPRYASPMLQTMPGFVWNQEKTKIIAWSIGIFLMAAAFGAVLGDLETYFADMEILQAFLPGNASLTEEFVRLLFAIMSLFTSIPVITMLTDLKKEEDSERLDQFYSRSVSRTRVMSSYYFLGIITMLVLQTLLALGITLTGSQVMADPLTFSTSLELALLYLPSIWFLLGLVTLLVGLIPKITPLIWLYLAFAFIVLYVGNLLDFPDWLNSLSVFHHAPDSVEWMPLLLINSVALALSIIGLIGYNQRDINR